MNSRILTQRRQAGASLGSLPIQFNARAASGSVHRPRARMGTSHRIEGIVSGSAPGLAHAWCVEKRSKKPRGF